ncbi:T9SS type A sorting domain-containing protein [bacterium]|nr:T9SS type A sorting domain-containing protein [bacterium]MBU1651708.1 T9SS type A sorting domain-containing protein [bacterium]MBU1882134.1 T9SS type A sorting domain-containing protein [bacterium]
MKISIHSILLTVLVFGFASYAISDEKNVLQDPDDLLQSTDVANPRFKSPRMKGLTDCGADNPLTTSFEWEGQGSVRIVALALAGASMPSGVFNIDDIPPNSEIIYATYCHDNLSYEPDPVESWTIFNEVSLDTTTPTDKDPFLPGEVYNYYRHDVTNIVTGNGSYRFQSFNLYSCQVAYLLIIFEHPELPNVRIVVNDGMEVLQHTSSTTCFDGFSGTNGYISAVVESGNPGSSGEMIQFNGEILAGPGTVFNANLGYLADYFEFPLTNLAPVNSFTLTTANDIIATSLAVLVGLEEDLSITIELNPVITPVLVPATGGNVRYDVSVLNTQLENQTTDYWTQVNLPENNYHNLVTAPISINLDPGINWWNESQLFPAQIQPGLYKIISIVGLAPSLIFAADTILVEKTVVGNCGSATSNSEQRLTANLEYKLDMATMINAVVSPNPFNPTTSLQYSIPAGGFVSMKVFDVMGREVAKLVDGYRDAGIHHVGWDASNMASGVYLYVLNVGDQHLGGKMVLLK